MCVPWPSPLFGRFGDLLQAPAGLLQLGQGVGRGQGWHGRVLDEGVGWVVCAEVTPAARASTAPGGVCPAGEDVGGRLQELGLLQALRAAWGRGERERDR